MGIFTRFTDIINSNITSLLDKAEDPQKMVRLIIQEMEDTLVEVRSTSAQVLAEQKGLTRQLEALKEAQADWTSKAELAISKDREDLARAALMEKQRLSSDIEAINQEITHTEEHLQKLKGELDQLQDKLNDAKARQKALLLRKRSVDSRLQVKQQLHSGKFERSMSKFDAIEGRIELAEAEVEAYDLSNKTLADEFAELEADDKVSSELEALKKKMAQGK